MSQRKPPYEPKTIVYKLLNFQPGRDDWEVSCALADGGMLLLRAGLADVENLHSVIREALQRESVRKLAREPKEK